MSWSGGLGGGFEGGCLKYCTDYMTYDKCTGRSKGRER